MDFFLGVKVFLVENFKCWKNPKLLLYGEYRREAYIFVMMVHDTSMSLLGAK